MKMSDRLLAMLFRQGIVSEGQRVIRVRRGRHGKAAGMWAWTVVDRDGCEVGIGSEDTMADCVRLGVESRTRMQAGSVVVDAKTG